MEALEILFEMHLHAFELQNPFLNIGNKCGFDEPADIHLFILYPPNMNCNNCIVYNHGASTLSSICADLIAKLEVSRIDRL